MPILHPPHLARVLLGLVLFGLVGVASTARQSRADENWSQFRGPRGDGKSTSTGLPLTWSETENVVWKTPIHDLGWSSPVVWGDQIWMTTASEDGKDMYVVCVDFKTGKVIHDIKLFHNEEPRFRHPTNSYASPTPVIEEGRVYAHFGSYGTACLDTASGKVLWERRDLPCDHFRGPGSSPILHDDFLFVAYDGFDLQYVVALDKKTGKTLWRKDRNIDYGTDNGDRKKAYCTATVIEHEGRTQIIAPSATDTVAYAPDGNELWRVHHGGMNAAARPLYGNGLVYIAAGDGGMSLVAVRPDGSGDVTDTKIEWASNKSVPKRPSQLLVDDLLFMIDDKGVASCLEAATGDIVWQQRISGAYWASPLYADGRIYCFSQEGDCPVIAASRDFELLAENKLDDGFNASAAVVGDSLILRTKTHLYRIEK
ncbi:MAG: PQQ-like beta-propeller repeat protein [Pirellulaceae bacterium]